MSVAITLSNFELPTLPALHADKYRGAVVKPVYPHHQDLQLPPVFCVAVSEPIERAIEMAYERDLSYIPVLNRSRRPMGFIDVAQLKKKWESGTGNPHDKANDYMQQFVWNPDQPYIVITPLTPLNEVEKFLKVTAATAYGDFALVTDLDRKFILAVVSSQDLENFVLRRGLGSYTVDDHEGQGLISRYANFMCDIDYHRDRSREDYYDRDWAGISVDCKATIPNVSYSSGL